MPDVLPILFFLGVFLVIITLVGHGIWVFLAFLLRGGQRKPTRRNCVFCGKSTPIHDNRCQWCMRDLTTALAAELADLDALLRQLERFECEKVFDRETLADIARRVKDYRKGLLAPPPPLVATAVAESVAADGRAASKAAILRERPLPETAPAPTQATAGAATPQRAAPLLREQIAAASAPSAQFSPPAPIAPFIPPAAQTPPSPPPAPRKSWIKMLGGFLAERNIQWTELVGVLVGGLLMVGCSILLVIAFWSQLESIPALKFLIFVGYSSAVFAAGLFVFHRWKLESTGRGLMVIATLLVPLNFLAMASFYKERWNLFAGAMELASLAIFTLLTVLAARVLAPSSRFGMTLAVIGNSIVVLAAARLFFEHASPGWLIAAGCAPPALLMASLGGSMFLKSHQREYDAAALNSLFTLLGIAAFSGAVALGLLAAQGIKFCGLALALHCLAVPLMLAAITVLGAGLQIVRGITEDFELQYYRVAGTIVALLGVVLQLAAIFVSWPQPLLIIVIGLVGAAGLAYLALRYDFPAVHAGAMLCLTLAYMAGFCLIYDAGLRDSPNQQWIIQSDTLGADLLRTTICSASGAALAGLLLAFGAASAWLARGGKPAHAKMYVGGACLAAAAGLTIVTAHGFIDEYGDAIRATTIYALYGIACIALSMRRRDIRVLSYLGWHLLAVAPMWLVRTPQLDVWQSVLAVACCAFWLGAIWVLLAWMHRKPAIFIAGQLALSAASILAALSWLHWRQWIVTPPGVLFKPENFQVIGIALGLLSLAWMAVRIASRPQTSADKSQPPQSNAAQTFLRILAPSGSWGTLLQTQPAIDKLTTYTVVVAQLTLAAGMLGLGCWQEFDSGVGGIKSMQLGACGACAWVLLGVLTLVLIASLWQCWRSAELQMGLLLALSVPVLTADRFVNGLAVASAARWTLSIGFVVCSSAIWGRKWLESACRMVHAQVELPKYAARAARGIVLALSALPVVLLTLQAAGLQLSGHSLYGPAAGTWFDKIGPAVSYLVPLVLVIAGLVGHALRESSAPYAFAAGVVAEMAVILGYALRIVMSAPARRFQIPEFVTMLQLAVITAAVWAIVWLIARRWVNVWREQGRDCPDFRVNENGTVPFTASANARLMNLQIALAVLGNAVLVAGAVLEIFLTRARQPDWAMQAGLPLGWCALLLTAGAGAFRRVQIRRAWDPHFVGLTGVALLSLLACVVPHVMLPDGTTLDGYWAYRVLMIGWSIYALLVALASWWVAALRTSPAAQGPPQNLIRLAAVWVKVAGMAAVVLGLKAALFHTDMDNERLWAAAAIAIACTAGATMAVWRRREAWAFAAALGVNLAASLVVWHFEQALHLSFDQRWVRLVQANVIASSVVTLFWLAAHRRLYALREWSMQDSPLLGVQTLLPILGNVAVSLIPVIALINHPQGLPPWMRDLCDPPGWLGLLLSAAAAAWYLYQTRAGGLVHVLGGATLGAGILFACTACGASLKGYENWAEYHLLLTAWAAGAFVLLGAAYAGKNLLLPEKNDPRHVLQASIRTPLFPKNLARTWVTLIGLLAAVPAVLFCHEDPSGVWWRLRALSGLSLAAAIVALWLRSAPHVFISALLLNVAATVAWIAWRPTPVTTLIFANVLCLAGTSIIWTLLQISFPRSVPHIRLDNKPLSFAHLAATAALTALGVLAFYFVASDLRQLEHDAIAPLGWYALLATVAAVAVCLWDRAARLPLLGLYVSGLIVLGMEWDYLREAPRMLCLRAGSDLAAFVLIAAIIGWLLPKGRPIYCRLLIPDDPDRWPVAWFMQTQAFIAATVILLNIWVSLDFGFDGLAKGAALFGMSGRLLGITSFLMLLGGTIVMAWQAKVWWRTAWQCAAFVTGLLLLCSLRWAGIDPAQPAPWLHRSIVLLVSAAMMTLVCSFGLRQVISRTSDWIDAGRRMIPLFGMLAAAVLVLTLIQEGLLFQQKGIVPLSLTEIIAVALVIAAMMATCLVFAVRSDWDPLGLSLSARQVYVYAAEVLLALIGVHLRLTKPELFSLGLIKNYWMLLVMAIAFAGAGLSELFHRLKLPVLSLPLERTTLLLPLVPAIGFWFQNEPQSPLALIGRSPDVWLLMGAFYGFLAYMRRSFACGALAVLAANMGLWVALNQFDISFIYHPQLWLIPIALAVLAAELLNHDRLTSAQSTTLRYLALSVIYVSSTADMFVDMFMHGVEIDWRLPIALMLLASAGAIAGAFLRIRSFLILGITFLVLDIITMIWHAAVDLEQTWIWSASGIVLGAIIIVIFALFEKRRQELLAAVERFREWER